MKTSDPTASAIANALSATFEARGLLEAKQYAQVMEVVDRALQSFAQLSAGPSLDGLAATAIASLCANGFVAARSLGQLQLARTYAERELAAANEAQSEFARVRALNNRGLARHELGALADAETDYRAALAIADDSSDAQVASLRDLVRNHLWQLLELRGEKEAITRLLEGPPTLSFTSPMVTASADALQLNTDAMLATEAGQFEQAERILDRAIAQTTATATPSVRGILACNRAEVYRRSGRPADAIAEFRRAIAIHASDPGCRAELAIDYVNLGDTCAHAGHRQESLDAFKRAWEAIRIVAPHSLTALLALAGIARARLAEGIYDKARAALWRGLALYEEMRPEIAVTESGHSGFLRAYRTLLELGMYLALHQGWPDELRGYIERGKARFARERVARGQPADIEGHDTRSGRDVTGFNGLVLNFFVGPNATFLAYEYNSLVGGCRIDADEGTLATLVHAVRDDVLTSSRRQGEQCAALSELLFKKVGLEPESVRHIHIMPDGPLWYVPFEALPAPAWIRPGDAGPLGAVSPTSYVPSVTVLDGLRRRNAELSPATSWQVLACGDPIHHTSLPPLPGAARELDELSTLLGNVVTPLRGADATAAAFLSRAPTASHIHIASHAAGSIDGAEPFVLFSGDGDDQFLYASQVQAASLRADLVVLSACSTSIGQASIGEGAMSMARAFLWAGCRCVLATFWPAQDDMTAFWVQLFYASLLKEKSVARAAYAAREELRQMHARMRHWTAFQVFGDGDSWDDRYSLAHLRSPRHEPDER